MAIGGDEGVLDAVGGQLAISEHSHGHGPHAVPVAPEDLTEGVGVPTLVRTHEGPVVELAQGTVHDQPRTETSPSTAR